MLVMGGGVTGQLAAAYLRKLFSNLKFFPELARHATCDQSLQSFSVQCRSVASLVPANALNLRKPLAA